VVADEQAEALLQLGKSGGLLIVDVVLAADAFGGGLVAPGHEGVADGTLGEAGQLVEDGSVSVVQQQDAQVAAQVGVPQGVLVVEEAEVADDAEDERVGCGG